MLLIPTFMWVVARVARIVQDVELLMIPTFMWVVARGGPDLARGIRGIVAGSHISVGCCNVCPDQARW